ncbi:prealbumin-like fold domain-containing protein [Paeniglutamicibacter sp. R2-26]|uniref:DUF7927 domain-containing protein n=1 Tax=Paeniglutamicibacter sp. R2-26 TaxID=3144417 RepID=UPI003EE765BC
MMFGGGGFNPAVASPVDSTDPAVEKQLTDATEETDPAVTASAEKPSGETAEPEPAPAPKETEEPAAEKPAAEEPATVQESAAPAEEAPASKAPAAPKKQAVAPSDETKKPEAATAEAPASEPTPEPDKESKVAAALAGVPGVCDTNNRTGKVDTFMQRSDITQFANGNLSLGLYEGGFVHQRIEMIQMQAGENELVFTYKVREAGKWAYDYLAQYSMTGGTITNTEIVQGSGNERVDTVKLTFDATASSVTLFFSAHIASELDHGPGTGASSIHGSPYHVNLVSLNCASTGSRDNQIKAGDVQAGSVTIVKDATPADGTDFDFNLASAKTQSSVNFQLDDSASSNTGAVLPDRVTYTVAPGGVTVSEKDLPAGWNLSDLVCTGVTATINKPARTATFDLADNANVTCTFTNTKTTYKDLKVTKTAKASYDRDYDWTIDKSVAPGRQTVNSATANVPFTYGVLVKAGEPKDSNFKVTGTITVENPNQSALNAVTLADSLPGATCSISTAGGNTVNGPISIPSGTSTFDYTCAMPAGTNGKTTGTNTATATWNKASYFGTSGQAQGTAGFDFSKVTPTVTDDKVTVTDDKIDLSNLPGGNVVTVAQSPKTFTYNLTWPGVVGECTEYTNNAKFVEANSKRTDGDSQTVELCIGAPLEVSKNVISSFDRSYLWDITKTAKGEGPYMADPETGEVTVGYDVTVKPKNPAFTDSTWAMSGVISVKNPNDWQDITATVGDSVDVGGGAVCAVTGVVGGGSDADGTAEGFQAVIPKGKTVQFDYSCTFTGQPSYTGTNTATATWDATAASTAKGSAQGTAPVDETTWSQNPLNKTITVTDDEFTFDPAWVVTWSKDMAPQTRSYELTWTVEAAGTCQTFTNTAAFTGSNDLTGSDSADIEACRSADLSVSKTVDAAFDRTYLWGIEKSLAQGQDNTVTTGAGGEAEVDYDVTVTSQGYTDSNKTLAGRITVTNPNRFGGETQVTVADQTTINGLVCTVDPAQDANPGTDGVQLNVPRATEAAGVWTNGTATVAYNCDASSVLEEDYTGNTNTATITWNEGRNTASSSAVAIDFTLGETTDETVEVFDNEAVTGGEGKLLGTVSWDEVKGKDPRSKTFTYTLTHTAEGGTCAPFTNTAWVELAGEGTNPSGDATVTVCSQLGLTAQKTANASFEREYFWNLLKKADKTRVEITDGSAQFSYTVSATPKGFEDSNYALTGQITLVNPNRFAEGAITATVKDTVNIGGLTCVINAEDTDLQAEGLQVLVPAASDGNTGALVLGYSCSGVPATYTGTNVVDVTWTDVAGAHSTSAQAPVNYLETASTNKTIEVTDDKVFDTENPESLGTADWNSSGTATEFTYQLSFPGTAGACTDYTNTAVIKGTETSDSETVTVCVEKKLALGIEASASFDRDHDWKVEKEADKTSFNVDGEGKVTAGYTVTATETGHADSNWKLGGKITVTNPNGFGEILATIDTELSLDGVTCTITDTDADVAEGFQVLVPAGETKTLTYTCDVSAGVAEADYLDQTTAATATWADGRSAASEPASFDFEMDGETDTEVTVTDDKYTENGNVLGTATLAESPKTFTYDVEWEGVAGTCTTFTNTAVLAGDDDNPSGNSDSADIEVCVEKGLTVVKTVDAQYTRDYNWKVEKKADKTSFTVDGDGTVLADYTVTATRDGHTDQDWAMSGSIDVFNPNLQGEMAVDVADVAGIPGTVCTVAGGGQNVTVPAAMLDGGSVVPGKATVTYDCDLPETVDAADYEGKQNTATITWTGVDGKPRTADFAADIEFKQTESIDETVTVVDDRTVPGTETELGTVGLGDSPKEFTYQVELAGDAGKCTTFTNTAVLREDAGANDNNSATADVEVCGKMGLGVSKTANASFDREYLWDLKKKVDDDKDGHEQEGEEHSEGEHESDDDPKSADDPKGEDRKAAAASSDDDAEVEDGKRAVIGLDGAATFDYTVIATPDGYVDSNHSLTGQITLTNQNEFEGGGTVATVSDNVDIAGLTCVIDAEDIDPDTEGLQVLVPAGSTGDKAIVLDYSCTGEPENGDYEGLNTATATWTNVAGATDRATGTASVTYVQQGSTNYTVDVYDDKTTDEPLLLGTATWNPEDTPTEFNYPLTFTNTDMAAENGTCKTYTNTATIPAADKSDSEDVEVCVEVGAPTVEKTVTGTTQGDDGSWSVTYDLVVTGDASLLGRYSLEDTLRFGDGIEINSASWTGPGAAPGDDWDLETPNYTEVLATDKLIAAGTTEKYTVTVNATVAAGVAGSEAGNCELAEGEDGTGFLNSATITANGKDAVSEDCATPVTPTFEKRAVELVQHNGADGNWDGTWDARYDLVVANPGTDGQAVNYSLADSPEFAGGVVINDRYATTEDGTVNAAWNGKDSTDTLVAKHVELGAGESDTYRVTVNVTLGADIATDERTCPAEGSEGGKGLLNSGTLTSGNETTTDEACLEIPAPEANVVKTATGATENPDGTWDVGYTVVVNNNSDVETRYDLTDTLRFGEGLDATEATWVLEGTDVQGAWENPGTEKSEVMAEGRILGARSSETYTVTVKVTPQEGAIGSDEATCDSGENPEDSGFLNEATLSYNGSTTASRDCTTPVENPRGYSLEKTSDPASGETVWPGDEIDYTLTVKNTGEFVYTGAVVTDDMSGWEDAATLDEESLEVSGGEFTIEGSEIIWTVGDLAVGESKTFTYTVTVDDEAWDEILVNVATGNGDVPPSTTEHPTPEYHKLPEPPVDEEEEPEPEVEYPDEETEVTVPPRRPVVPLADTGASDSTLWIVGGGAVVLLLGAGLLAVARRRRNEGN